MTEQEFEIEYTERLSTLVDKSIEHISSFKDLSNEQFTRVLMNITKDLDDSTNNIVSKIFDENNLSYNFKVVQENSITNIYSVLVRKTWSVRRLKIKKFDDFVDDFIKENYS